MACRSACGYCSWGAASEPVHQRRRACVKGQGNRRAGSSACSASEDEAEEPYGTRRFGAHRHSRIRRARDARSHAHAHQNHQSDIRISSPPPLQLDPPPTVRLDAHKSSKSPDGGEAQKRRLRQRAWLFVYKYVGTRRSSLRSKIEQLTNIRAQRCAKWQRSEGAPCPENILPLGMKNPSIMHRVCSNA